MSANETFEIIGSKLSMKKQQNKTKFFAAVLLAGKLIISASKKSSLSAILLLIGKLTVSTMPILYSGCTTLDRNLEQEFGAQPYYFSMEQYQLLRELFGDFLGKDLVIFNIEKQVEQIKMLKNKDAVSFTIDNMPLDIKQILENYKLNNSHENYYGYVSAFVDRIVLCPDIVWLDNISADGLAVHTFADEMLYPAERIILVNNRLLAKSIVFAAAIIVHEASHKEIIHLVKTGQLSEKYISNEYHNINERYACIVNQQFFELFLMDWQFHNISTEIRLNISMLKSEIKKYNIELGLPPDDRTFFPR